MKDQAIVGASCVTVGGSWSRNTITGIGADMSWLGDPPTAEQAARYEILRAGKIAAARAIELSALESQARQLMVDISASESPVRRTALVEKLNEQIAVINKTAKRPRP